MFNPWRANLEEGFEVWVDRNIPVGTEWREEIDKEIRKSIALIVIMTPKAKESEYVTYEWAFAYGAGVRVIPLIHHIKPDDLHPRLETLQYVEYEDPLLWDKLIDSLQNAQSSYLTIHHAVWGPKEHMNNVTSKVRENASTGRIEMLAHRKILGEPFHGKVKKLVVFYSYGGIVDFEEVEEYGELILPK